ncbi:hypothetical protein QWY80_09630 [Halomonas ramblicola]|nr:hypothetical protein [Halomonas ramblicola]
MLSGTPPDAAGALAFMAPNRSVLELIIETWPEIEFNTTREINETR